MKPTIAILALINSMIGGVIMPLPLETLRAGIIVSTVFILLTGVSSYYSAYLYLEHLGPHPDFDVAIYYHYG